MNKPKVTSQSKRYLVLIVLLINFSGSSQNAPGKIYNQALDSLWSSNVFINKISPNGKWAAHTEVYDKNKKKLTLINTENKTSFTFENCNLIEFSNDSKWFSGISDNQELILVDLLNQSKEVYTGILKRKADFSKSGNYLAAYQKIDDNPVTLFLINLKTKAVTSIPGVAEFIWHPFKDHLLLIEEQGESRSVVSYNAKTDNSIALTEKRKSTFRFLKWSKSGNAVFLEEQNDKRSLHYINPNNKLVVLKDGKLASMNPSYRISGRNVYISNDGEKILFYRELIKKQTSSNSDVEVWDTKNPWIYPRLKYYKEMELQYALTAWYPKTGELVAIETEQTPTAALNVNHDYALVYNQLDYEPLYKHFPNSDLYVKNMKTGNTRLVTKNQYTEGKFITISPYGNYISYFKENHWWVYDIENDKTVNLTENLSDNFENAELEFPGDQYPYGNPGWLGNDEKIILYDRHDIWLMTPDGKEKSRVTKGKEENLRYRISKIKNKKSYFNMTINPNLASLPFNLKNGLLLEVFDNNDYKSGFAIWQGNNAIKSLPLDKLKPNNVFVTKDLSDVFYTKENFNTPIGVYQMDLDTNEEELLYQSNEDLLEYDFGNVELIEYTAPSGKKLKGALVYPAHFNPDKKYPMIVHIYERESRETLKFTPPTDFVTGGYNLLKFTTNGYFVFYPDFTFTLDDPGISALKSLTTAVNKVLEKGNVDKERIGLIGHSFGGYETAFIITQTDMFAGAVAGAALTDPVSFYHNIFWDYKTSQMWRMENQQRSELKTKSF